MFWLKFTTVSQVIGSWGFVILCLILIIGAIALIVNKIQNRIHAIICTAGACILCTFLFTVAIDTLIATKEKDDLLDEHNQELNNYKLKLEKEEEKNKNIVLQNKNSRLQEEIDLLKHAQISMNSLNRICELALLETHLQQTDVQKENLMTKQKKGQWFLFTQDKMIEKEILYIATHDINAKYGIDLKKVYISEVSNNVLHISGIKCKYIGSDSNTCDHTLTEIRQLEYKIDDDGNPHLASTSILNDADSLQDAHKYQNQYDKDFQEKFSKGLESSFMDEAVIKLAQNFITVTLAPLKKELVFEKDSSDTCKPILDYLNDSIAEKEDQLKKLQNNE